MISKTSTGRIPNKDVVQGRLSSTASKPNSATSMLKSATPKTNTIESTATCFKPIQKISTLNAIKVVSPLGNGKHKTPFATIYAKGGIPCQLQHGSVKHKLLWKCPIQDIDYNPLFIVFCQGLMETQHPYVFVVRQGLKELMAAPNARDKVANVLPQAIAPLRCGLGSKEKESFLASLEILRMIALLVGTLLTPHLSSLLPQVASRILAADQDIRESVQDCLCDCQIACGPAALKIIRSRVPTFSSMLV
ncbi:hypothetical protein BSLG_008034 [Batrachochytrium salamandrivorans]|nr:hypothetical protein BASA83_004747 [Batrachochytrium salamandrivorans]KAJ1334880.1 hypothetical protein BSLG_008034 [Batrachochytrium salamandrivorans]